ncbi:MAG: glycosyltransferase family 4 protein [Marinilabiliaceae bacterium]|nr:glycosyltransferase family 4 protein [Marinilabiliaceae bacterium]
MKILFVSIAWPATGINNLYTNLMDEFVRNGHQVFVVGTREDVGGEEELVIENQIRIVRVSSGKIRKASYLTKFRSLFFLGGKIRKAVIRHYGNEKIDLIIGPTPPITLSFMYKKLKKRFDAPFYLLLKDIWPQGSVDLQVFKRYSVPWMFFRLHEIRIYKTADYIGTMSELGVKYILSHNRFLNPVKVEVCPNSIKPIDEESINTNCDIRQKYNIPSDACVFLFSGNLGPGHGLHFFVDAIKALSDYDKAYFVIGGSGTYYKYLDDRFKEFSPKNALLYSWLPREDYEQIVATSNVGLIFLYRYTSPQYPSRLLSYLEYSKPVLCAVNAFTDIGTIVEKYECGKSVEHGNLNDFIDVIKFFCENANLRKSMGEKGRKLLMNKYTVGHCYDIIMKHF